ncbi:MAG: DUF4055 domain-containing protein [Pseudomonadaceae bacterium]|nr:DUF4055 domain-containing protein [Pseudomonadaceae bacterium]
MRKAGKTYLPMHPAEINTGYEERLSTSVFTNFYSKIVKRMIGKLMDKPPAASEEAPERIGQILDNLDLCGNSIEVFSRSLLESAIDDGLTHLLIDHPTANSADVTTLADEQSARPFVRLVTAKEIINWDSEIVDGVQRLTRVHLMETVEIEDPEDPWFNKTVPQVRVIRPGAVEIWRENDKNEWVQIDLLETDFEEIPLVTLYTRKTGFMTGKPLLLDVAHLNVKHWQSNSDQQYVTHQARVPILHLKQADDGISNAAPEIVIAPNRVVKTDTDGDLKYVEINGKNVETGRQEVLDIEDHIRRLGSEVMLSQRPGSATATARALDQSEADVDLSAIAGDLEDALNNMLTWLGFWIGEDNPGAIHTFQDFKALARDEKDVETLLKMYQSDALSLNTLLEESKRRGLLDDRLDLDTEIALIENTREFTEGGDLAA